MKKFLRFLRPLVFMRRKAILAGLLGGNRRWLMLGGLAWVFHWLGQIFGTGQAKPRYTRELKAGERLVVVHEPVSPRAAAKVMKKAARGQRKASERAR